MSKKISNKKIAAVVLAAGQGKRMVSNLPKVLHPVCGMPMISLVLRNLEKAGIKDIIVVAGHGKDKLRKILPSSVRIVEQSRQLGTGHALNCARKLLKKHTGDLLVTCGDMPLLSADTYKRLIQKHTKNKLNCTVVTGIIDDPSGYGRIIRDEEGYIRAIGEDKDLSSREKKNLEINSGAYCFRSRDIFGVLPAINKKNVQKEFYLTDSVCLLVKKGCRVDSLAVSDISELMGVNDREDLVSVGKILNQKTIINHLKKGVTVVDPDTTYIDVRTKIGRDTVVFPFSVIEGEVNIGKNCSVGPFTHLRDKSILKDKAEVGNFVEVKKSTVGKHTKAKHLTYLGDTVLGANVNIGAGTITANYDGKNKYLTVIKDRVFIGSNTTLVAPIVVGKGAVTGAGSVVLKNRNISPNTIVVGAPARVLRKKNKK